MSDEDTFTWLCGTCRPAVVLKKLKRWQLKGLDLAAMKKGLRCPTHGETFHLQEFLQRDR
jgi:hypothetical protein